MIAHQRLPEKLIMLLQNPRVRKVGRMVSSDLKQLQATIHSSSPFTGALDLANYAKDRRVISNAKCSLTDLCAVVIGKRLNKNVSERISAAWEHTNLTSEQQHYAACDAYVPLILYHTLSKLSVPKPLPSQIIPFTPVLLYNSDNTVIIATGHLASNLEARTFDDVNISPSRTLVEISKVLVPAAIISSHSKRALKSFGPPCFLLVCLRSHLYIYDPTTFSLPANEMTTSTLPANENAAMSNQMSLDNMGPSISNPGAAGDNPSENLDADCWDDGMGDFLRASLSGVGSEPDEAAVTRPTFSHPPQNVDIESKVCGEKILSSVARSAGWDDTLRSRVLKDIFHVFNMLRLSRTHALRKEFGRALRDTLFIPDQEDRMRISAWAATLEHPKTFEQLEGSQPDWLRKRCRRVIPPPQVLFPLVEKLFLAYGPLKDSSTQLPLFNQQNWKTAKQILELIHQGSVSDPPGIPLYTVICLDAKAGHLPIYRCSRGTNFTEGGVHTHLRSRLPTSGASVRHVNACLCDFVLQHNLRVRN